MEIQVLFQVADAINSLASASFSGFFCSFFFYCSFLPSTWHINIVPKSGPQLRRELYNTYVAFIHCSLVMCQLQRVIEVRPLSPSKRISIDSTAVITTTTASTTLPLPTATAGSSSAQQKPFPLSWKRPIPETVITVPSTSSKDYEIIEDVESVTSSEPEVVSLRSSKSVESLQILNVPSNVPATLPLPFPNLITETVIPVEIHNERRSSTRSEGVPTMWESFKILGKHYTGGDSTKSRASSTTSLDSLIRRSELVQVVQPRLSTVNRSSFPEVFHFTSMASHPNTTKIVPSQEAYPNPTELPAEIPPAAQEAVQSRRASSVVEDEGHMKLAAMLGMDVHDSSQSSLESTLPLKPFAHLSETQSEHPQESSKVLPVEDPASEVAVPLATQIQTLPTAEEIINMAAENIAFKATTEAIEDSVGRTSTQIPAARSREQSRSPETRRESKVSLEETKKPLKFGQPEKKVKPKVREEKLKKSPAARRKTEGTPTSSTTSKNLELESPLVVRRPVSLRRPLPPDQPQLEAKARPKKPELPSIRRPHLPQKPPSKPAKLNQRLERIEESDSMTTDGEMGPGRFKKEQKGLKLADKTRFPTLHEPITKPDVKPEKKSVPPKLPRKLPDKVFPPCDDYQKPKMHRQWQTTSDTSSHGDLVTSDAEISEDLKLVLRKVELKEETPKRAARNGVRERSRRARKYSSTEALSDSSPPQFRLPTSCPQTARVRRDQHYKSKDNLYKSRLPVRQNKIEESLRKFNCTAMNDDFIGADIDIDLPGPFTIPVDFSDLKRHRPRFGSHSSLHKSAIPRPVKLFSSEHDIRTVVSTADRRYVSNLARKIANRKKHRL
ncbi:hypothetical protein L596_003804 [Steinernema carpocapsae]|uniref:Uncharacterized protein n=1 Tax=Steinernema carpocapsae TaxID=34508 RepID=A0A4U8UVC5_STECR|nr:hypothetical protein L596_003804 [Steinernema carpocapsae]